MHKRSVSIERKKQLKSYLLVFTLFLILSILIQQSAGDDWDWGSNEGLKRLADWFDNYNGRYFGNIVILTITRLSVVRVLFYALINTVMVYSMTSLVRGRNLTIWLITGALIIIPTSVYAQTFGWYSGFANYNVSMALLLFSWTILLKNRKSIVSVIVLSIVTILGQLCMENVTLFAVFAALVFIFLLRQKVSLGYRLAYLFSTVIGCGLMFSNSVYSNIASNQDGYRKINLQTMIDTFLTKFIQYYFIDNWLLFAMISVLFIILFMKFKKINYPIVIVILLFNLANCIFKFSGTSMYNVPIFVAAGFAIVGILMLILLLFYTIISTLEIQTKTAICVFGLASGIVLSPMLMITPFGPRVMLTAYVFLVMLMATLVQEIVENDEQKNIEKYLRMFTICGFLILFGVHATNDYYLWKRPASFSYSQKNKEVQVVRLPFEQFGHHMSPPEISPRGVRNFKEHYGVPKDYHVEFVPFTNQILEDEEN